MKKGFLLVPLALLILSCGVFSTPVPPDSGITGQTFLGPICPVVREGEECPDQPYQATITVNNLKGRKIVQFQTDEDGHFIIPLAPGEYILHPETPDGMPLPYASEQHFTVYAGEYTSLIVLYDSGIR